MAFVTYNGETVRTLHRHQLGSDFIFHRTMEDAIKYRSLKADTYAQTETLSAGRWQITHESFVIPKRDRIKRPKHIKIY
jgi:hypothetical protein